MMQDWGNVKRILYSVKRCLLVLVCQVEKCLSEGVPTLIEVLDGGYLLGL